MDFSATNSKNSVEGQTTDPGDKVYMKCCHASSNTKYSILSALKSPWAPDRGII